MSKRKVKELQKQVHSQEEFDALLETKGLKVVDVYSEWCGPCLSLQSTYKRLRTELVDDLLIFATACADEIDFLAPYRGRSEPCTLFYGKTGTFLTQVVRGAKAPIVERHIRNELKLEHDFLSEASGPRESIVDQGPGKGLPDPPRLKSAKSKGRIVPREITKPYTFAMIKPHAVQTEGAVEAILAKIEEAGFKVAHQDELTMTTDLAEQFYAEHKGKEFFPNLQEKMTSGPVQALVLTAESEDVVAQWRDTIGPTNPADAKEDKPESIRAVFGEDVTQNAVHGSDSDLNAQREIFIMFPAFAREHLPQVSTVLVLQSDVVGNVEDVRTVLAKEGFKVAKEADKALSKEEAAACLGAANPEEQAEAVEYLTSGECKALLVERVAGYTGLGDVLGPADPAQAKEVAPDSLIASFGVDEVKTGFVAGTTEALAAVLLETFFAPPPAEEPAPAAGVEADGEKAESADVEIHSGLDKLQLVAHFEKQEALKEVSDILADKAKLKDIWKSIDFNGNGKVSLAEIDKFCVDRKWEVAKPPMMRAYKQTTLKDGDGDAWVERKELPALLRNLYFMAQLWEIFDDIDSSDDRRIEVDEFRAGVAKMGIDMSEEQAAREFAVIDKNGGGKILFDEFCACIANVVMPDVAFVEDEEKAAEPGEVPAVSGSGLDKLKMMAHFEKKEALKEVSDILADKAKLKDIWEKMDFNNNGKVSLAEIDKFCVEQKWEVPKPAMMRAYKQTTLKDGDGDAWVERKELPALLRNLYFMAQLWEIFDDIDSSDDRRIEVDEFRAGVAKMGIDMSEEEAAKEFAVIDKNGGGKILFDEFCAFLANIVMPDVPTLDD